LLRPGDETAWLAAVAHRATFRGETALVERSDGTTHLLSGRLARALGRIGSFAPAELLARVLGEEGAPLLARLAHDGWLWSLADLRAGLRAVPTRPPKRVEAIAVPTRGPSPHLSRLLAALGASAPVRVYVDDPDPGAATEIRAAAPHVEVIGADERRRWLDALAARTGLGEVVAALTPPRRCGT
jgi:hypothetical protein